MKLKCLFCVVVESLAIAGPLTVLCLLALVVGLSLLAERCKTYHTAQHVFTQLSVHSIMFIAVTAVIAFFQIEFFLPSRRSSEGMI